MNILIVCNVGMYRDLSASFIHAQAKAYVELGHKVRVIVSNPAGKTDRYGHRLFPAVAMQNISGVEEVDIRGVSLSNLGEKGLNAFFVKLAAWLHFSKLFSDFQPDVIHAHTLGVESEFGAWLKSKLHCPLVVTTHGTDTFGPYTFGNKGMLKRYADKADQVICVSSLLKKCLLDCGVTAPMNVILNGFHVRHIPKTVEKVPYSMVQAGYLVERKKADITIRAYAKLSRQYPELTLEIIGSGDQLDRYRNLCKELGVTDGVRFRGFLPNEETLAEMAKAQFFCMPSVREGFGIVYLEAMASGCITIGTEGEGIADLIENGKNGFLVPPEDPEAIARVVEWCLEHPEESEAVAQQGRRDALSLTWERNAAQYIDLFGRM